LNIRFTQPTNQKKEQNMAYKNNGGKRKFGLKELLLATPAFAAMASGAPAMAQEAEQAGDDRLGEIVITAQKREENLQSVPISVVALGTEKLDELNVSDFNDYVKYLPSVSFQSVAPGFSNVYFRGVASGGDGNHSASLPSVGIYLDEQPITTIQGALDMHIYDISRVEALAGPQGTLYGASSQAGTLRIITNKPEIGKFAAAAEGEVNSVSGGDQGYVVQGYINQPINEKMAVRLVGWHKRDAGYIDNVAGGFTFPTSGFTQTNRLIEDDYNYVETTGLRAALKIDLNEHWTVTPQIMAQHQNSEGSFGFDQTQGDLKLSHTLPENSDDRWAQAAATIEGRIGNFDVTMASAYLRRDVDTQSDYADYAFFYDSLFGSGAYFYDEGGVNPINDPSQRVKGKDRYDRYTTEFRIASPTDWRLSWIAGAFIQRQQHDIEQRYVIDGLFNGISVTGWPDTIWLTKQERIERDYAIFGEATFDFTDKLSATGGVRVFRSDNSLEGFFGYSSGFSSRTGEAACFRLTPFNGAPCVNLDRSVKEDGESFKLNATYQLTDDKLFYATFAEGFRPGGVNRRGTLPPYVSDFLTSYEVGWKTTWGNQFRWNGAIFTQTWDNFQFSFLGANGLTEITNAPEAEIDGIETDFAWTPTDNLTISGAISVVDATLSKTLCRQIDPTTQKPFTVCDAADPDAFSAPAGTELPVTPEVKGSLLVRYEWASGNLDYFVQGGLSHRGRSWTDLRLIEREIIGRLPAYTTLDFSGGVSFKDYFITGYVENLEDERGQIWRFAQCAEQVCGGRVYTVPTRPRTIGIRFGKEF
jgi:outer membrane receptor protein involved in Fe transport